MVNFRLASFNLENLGSETADQLEIRLPILRPQIERLGADIYCFQEVNAPREGAEKGASPRSFQALDRLLEGTGAENFDRATTHSAGKEEPRDVHNLVVASRFPILRAEQFHHTLVSPVEVMVPSDIDTETGLLKVRFDRPILHTVLKLDETTELHVINLHLRAPSGSYIKGQKAGPFRWKSVQGWAEAYYLSSLKRCGQALETRLLVDRILDDDPAALIAVCGDFNAEQDEVPLRLLIASDEDTGDGALARRSLVPLERSLPEDRLYTVIHRGRKQMFDHILVSQALLGSFRSLEVHNETLGDEAWAYDTIKQPPESFHAPLVASFGDVRS